MTHFGLNEQASVHVPTQPNHLVAGGEALSLASVLRDDLPRVEQGVDWFAGQVRERLGAGASPDMRSMVDAYLSILERGGKRARGALTVIGYAMAGGENDEVAAQAAGITEGIQATL